MHFWKFIQKCTYHQIFINIDINSIKKWYLSIYFGAKFIFASTQWEMNCKCGVFFTEIAKNWKVAWFECSNRINNVTFCNVLRLIPFLMGLLNYFLTDLSENQQFSWVAREGSINNIWNFPPKVYIKLQHQNDVKNIARA